MLRAIRVPLVLFSLLLGFVVSSEGRAQPTCTTTLKELGAGMRETEECKAPQLGPVEAGRYDAYYSIRVGIDPGPAFSSVGSRLDASTGKILGRMVEKLFGVDRGRALSIAWQATIGGQTYPAQTLLSFARATNGDWIIDSSNQGNTLMHRLSPAQGVSVKLIYLYSNRAKIDLSQMETLFPRAASPLASEGTAAVIDLARSLVQVAYDADSGEAHAKRTVSFSPEKDGQVSSKIEIRDPFAKNADSAEIIATVSIRLRGTRSLMIDPANFEDLGTTFPRDGALDASALDRLTSFALQGSPGRWPAAYSALAGMASSAPLGSTMSVDEPAIRQFCNAATQSIRRDFPLTTTDETLLRAAVLQIASASIKNKVNPFPICFPNATTRSLIAEKLGLDTEYIVSSPPSEVPSLKNEQLLRNLAAWLVAKSCTYADIGASPLATFVSDQVKIVAREGLAADNRIQQLVLTGPDREVARNDFLRATCGAFPYWNSLSAKDGQLQVDNVASKGGWVVTGSIVNGKMNSFRIVPAG